MVKQAFRLSPLVAGVILAAGSAFAMDAAGPEPYVAADPVYAPMTKESDFQLPPPSKNTLGTEADIKGSAAGPQPYTAVDPMYPGSKPKP